VVFVSHIGLVVDSGRLFQTGKLAFLLAGTGEVVMLSVNTGPGRRAEKTRGWLILIANDNPSIFSTG
jgi:hypothetical protein